MARFIVVIREIGGLKPDYSLEFEAHELPREGDYLSIHRPDKEGPYGEDVIVRRVWWRLEHPETAGFAQDPPKVGSVNEIFVECEPASGPYSSRDWLRVIEGARGRGAEVPAFEVARFSVPEPAPDRSGGER